VIREGRVDNDVASVQSPEICFYPSTQTGITDDFKNSLPKPDNEFNVVTLILQHCMQAISTFQFIDASSATQRIVHESAQVIPGTVQYTIKRFVKPDDWMSEDLGMLRYHFEPGQPEANYLELRFCVTGNMYCRQYDNHCQHCQSLKSAKCQQKMESIDLLSFVFNATLLSQFITSHAGTPSLSEDILRFRHDTSFSRTLPLCNKTRAVLEGLLNHNYTDSLENIYVNAQTQMLLLYSLDCMLGEKEINTITCKFLANEADRDKVIKAREVLIQHIGEPITIKELSRKVAMNECYLKKGFKEMFGTTIFEFYQSQRMEHAKYLLYEKGLSVTEVSVMLGYSSISHFSTAFKKHTGIKPCELLLR
jgi:AraC-like DNA-binding protein